jgi:YidC/Oxa1 family membrane protein insertase
MDNFRLLLFFALAFVLLLLYQAWMKDYGTPPQQEIAATTSMNPTDPVVVPQTQGAAVPDVGVEASVPAAAPAGMAPMAQTGDVIHVQTDVLRVELSTVGGSFRHLELLNYPVDPDRPDIKVQLFKPQLPNFYLAQSGFVGSVAETAPTHEALFSTEKTDYQLADGQDSLSVALTWQHDSGIKVTKTYVFQRGSYLVDVIQKVENASDAPWTARSYAQLQRSEFYDPNKSSFIYTYTGAAYYGPEEKYRKLPFEDFLAEPLNSDIRGGWVGLLQHHFVGALIPPADQVYTFQTSQLDRATGGPRYIIRMISPTLSVPAQGSQEITTRLFTGPKLQNELESISPGLELVVDYGWLTILAKPIFWVLDHLHSMVGNWGWAIILLTILIKLAFYKLSETSYKSMANMRKLTPRLQALKDRFGDDKEKLNQAMMEMYKKEKINPLGGCLPILVQIPVFIALYWVLLESVEMRQAPFALWLDNLSAPDPYYVLPLIMGISMFIQQKLNPAPVDPMQAKLMMSMPIVFTVFFAFFPSGLVLYWTVNNILSIAQQWHITKNIENAAAKS